MNNKTILEEIIITDEDINWVESILIGIKFDECRREIIKNLDSVDIQACPGTGKTTVLIAKLAILAKKWPFQYSGICVLSHTNVAREEIQNRIGETDIGRKLLSYPHFIGTFHSFFDRFVGMPWIKSQSIPVRIVDSDYVLSKRWNQISPSSKYFLKKKYLNEACCEPISLPLKFDLKCKETSSTYKDVEKVVMKSHEMGYYTFDEMILFAKEAIDSSKNIQLSSQKRFPFLFIDEAQDTNRDQWNLIGKLFIDNGYTHIRQSYGDSNQAIYNSYNSNDESMSFPRDEALSIQNSKRFGGSIASIANKLAINSNHMAGDESRFEYMKNCNTIFLFEEDTIGNVIPAYARLILESFTEKDLLDYEYFGCHVVGMVHTNTNQEAYEFAKRVSNYWEPYNPEYTNEKPKSLIDYFHLGKSKYEKSKDVSILAEWISKGILRYLVMFTSLEYSNSNHAFRTLINIFPTDQQINVRRDIREILFEDISTPKKWERVLLKIRTLLDNYIEIDNVSSNFFKWKENVFESIYNNAKEIGPNTCFYVDKESGNSLKLNFGSIHSVKGRTHLATLILETKWHEANIKSILPWFTGNIGNYGKRNSIRLKCHYVALTRAKGLICIALPKEYVSDTIKGLLAENGWNIKEV
ncbi:UvrD-helicase domain-containing protein [Gudongella sp. DL1XJH-153]|uniref:UvrD-helicase domain-containing protein n=1 Tax=Gudongella sp. DL1XJH-153 TaxID=3409804 RepID=UPI003BB595C8